MIIFPRVQVQVASTKINLPTIFRGPSSATQTFDYSTRKANVCSREPSMHHPITPLHPVSIIKGLRPVTTASLQVQDPVNKLLDYHTSMATICRHLILSTKIWYDARTDHITAGFGGRTSMLIFSNQAGNDSENRRGPSKRIEIEDGDTTKNLRHNSIEPNQDVALKPFEEREITLIDPGGDQTLDMNTKDMTAIRVCSRTLSAFLKVHIIA